MKQVKSILLIISFLILSLSIHAQTIPHVLDSLLNKTLDSMRTVLNVKSLSAGIEFPNEAIWAHTKGISAVNVNVTTDDVYLIGSVTKTLTSACILQLAEENVLNLDDSLYKWVDTIPYINPNITIRQLLRHQSGIYDVLSNPNCQPALLARQDSIWQPEDLINTFIQAPNFQAGTSWSYSNTNYFLLGMIIKRATGNYFYEEIRNRFFTPLGLATPAIPAFEPLNSPVAHVWLDINGDNITDDAHFFYINYLSLNSVAGAAGGYYATPSDISKWIRRYMRGDLLSANLMVEAKTTVNSPGLPGTTYGLGLMKKSFIGYDGYGHGGDLAYAASSWYFPAKDISISVFTNDSKNNSWTLAPVVSALLKIYNGWGTIASGVEENAENISFSLTTFPNPFDNQLSISFSLAKNTDKMEFILTNVLGEKIESKEILNAQKGQNWVQFDNLKNLPSGMYFVSAFANGNLLKIAKVVK
jgi:D-alanyl-D-alanine carboxypeptidase